LAVEQVGGDLLAGGQVVDAHADRVRQVGDSLLPVQICTFVRPS
jgi:hypothetical protein